ncbi:TIGR02588 family protein [Rhizobium deserti]|uniref:TIGR02588 family protein n=1 Tax=Rhizobium deserti TaxID=2547961 RepID=A0A4R5UAE9_9HYPH|nr:TIGR02588 family protein [Rhizobium deserti]TDK31791.1 TIGR02588 family protein [Rhizobium deserti]
MTTTTKQTTSETDDPTWIEWATGMISALLVIVMIGWVAWQSLTEEEQQPNFTVAVTEKGAVDGGYRVTFEVNNTATKTASAVVVRGEILDGSNPIESADVTFDYVAVRSKSSGAIIFSQDPGDRALRIRAIGYTDP